MKRTILLAVACVAVMFAVELVQAATIYSGTIYNDSGFHADFPSIRAINQSGLSHNYVSGVTDYDAFVALNPTHTGASSNTPGTGALDPGVQSAFIDLDFGTQLTFTDFGLWNDVDTQGIKDFNILVSNSATFATGTTTLGTFTTIFPTGAYGSPVPLQQYSLGSTTGRYVRVDMLTTHGSTNINFGEYLFGATANDNNPVPEPTSLAIFGIGALCMGAGAARRRRKEKQAAA